jgi:alpha-beta hydrolase superfamily lysophospholipase
VASRPDQRVALGPSRPRRGSVLGLAAAVLVSIGLAACSSSSSTTGHAIPAPAGLPAFYSVSAALAGRGPGALIKSEKISATGVHGAVYRVMYLSESATGPLVPVTGLVVVPGTAPPPGGYPVVTWGHGTDGMADQCAESLEPTQAVPLLNGLLDRGWEVTASDYQGEGTPGLLPYLVGTVAARNTIDIVRAAGHLAAAHASTTYVIWGHSEGGQTAMFGLHIAASYAPELHLRGVVAGAPPSQFKYIYAALQRSPYRYYIFMAAAGFNAAYGNARAPLQQVLTPLGMKLLPVVNQGCSNTIGTAVDRYSLHQVARADPFQNTTWRPLLTANDPESFTAPSATPLLIIQGGADEQIPVVSTQLLAQHLCAIGQDLERWIYPGQSHAGVIAPSFADMTHWIADRFAGGPDPDPMVPVGQPDVMRTTCP